MGLRLGLPLDVAIELFNGNNYLRFVHLQGRTGIVDRGW